VKTFIYWRVSRGKLKMDTINKAVLIQSVIGIKKAANWAGSETALATLIGVRRQRLNYWKLYGLIPCDVAMKICVITRGYVDLTELRPDIEKVLKKFNKLKKYKKAMKNIFN
jgi:DNA-binding transcriptional regulator YdaS (Cro superfamily)